MTAQRAFFWPRDSIRRPERSRSEARMSCIYRHAGHVLRKTYIHRQQRCCHNTSPNIYGGSSSQEAAGTYGKFLVGFDVMESFVKPVESAVLVARENMTSGALSVSDRPFHSLKPYIAGVPMV
jgi:hypothetical protein